MDINRARFGTLVRVRRFKGHEWSALAGKEGLIVEEYVARTLFNDPVQPLVKFDDGGTARIPLWALDEVKKIVTPRVEHRKAVESPIEQMQEVAG